MQRFSRPFLSLLFFFGLSIYNVGAGGLTVGNGGGFAESNLTFAFKTFPELLKKVRTHPLFAGPEFQQKLSLLEEVASQEILKPENLKIVKDFPVAGESWNGRAFWTSSQPLTPIYVNLDALYPKDATGQVYPFSFAQSLGLVVRLMGARISQVSDEEWTNLGTKFSKLSQLKSELLYFGFVGMRSYEVPSVTSLHDPVNLGSWGILVTDAENTYDLLPLIFNSLKESEVHLEFINFSHLRWIRIDNVWSVEGTLSLKIKGQNWNNDQKRLLIKLTLKPSRIEPKVKIFDPEHVSFIVR